MHSLTTYYCPSNDNTLTLTHFWGGNLIIYIQNHMKTPYQILLLLSMIILCSGALSFASTQGVLTINGQRFFLKGASWFGFETSTYTVQGLWQVDYHFIIDFLASNKFNAVRLPFSLDMVMNNPNPNSINYGYCSNNASCNLDLSGLTSLQVMDKIINYMGTKGILVMLDMHSFQAGQASNNGYWFDSSHSEAQVIQGWQTLATRYQNTWNVFAMDVKNQPFSATWGTGNTATDFNLAVQRIANAVIANNNWLVFVQGITCNSGCFWGQNLQGVQTNPVTLNIPNRVVYSPHVYGPDVYGMSYFYDSSFPSNMPAIWDSHFGYIRSQNNSAVVTGEWGGSTSGLDGVWQNAYASYMTSKNMTDNFYWDVNPNSAGTGGLLQNDWVTPDTGKLSIAAQVVQSPTNVLNFYNGSNTNTTTGNSTNNSTNSTSNSTTNSTSNSTTNSTSNSTQNGTVNGTCASLIVYSSQHGMLQINGQRFNLKGASWFGFQTSAYTAHGLWQVDYHFLIDFLASNQFNAVRLPFSLDMVMNNPNPNSISYGYCSNNVSCNTDLKGLTSLQVMDQLINYMGSKGIVVMLDMHSFQADGFASNGYWFDSTHSEAQVIQGWQLLATRYRNTWNVFAMDVKNQPFSATWGTGNTATDFNLAVQRIANAVIANNNWLVFVQGTNNSPNCAQACFYGQNLQGVQTNPIILNLPNRLVYSPHSYGPNVYNQNYFSDATFPANMPAIWNAHFGFIKNISSAAVVIGEWGGATTGTNGVWMNAFSSYLKAMGMTDNFVWCLNPNSGDTGGLLLNDWITPDTAKLSLLAGLVPNPTNILSIVSTTGNCSSNSTSGNNTGNGANSTTGNGTGGNNTNSSQCQIGQTSLAGSCVSCSVFSCAVCTGNSSICITCLPSLYSIPDGSFCELCLLAPDINQCSQSSCSNYVFYNNLCISTCSNVTNANLTQLNPINGACLCNAGFVWTAVNGSWQCLACSSYSVIPTQCQSLQCSGFFWSVVGSSSSCTNCVGVGGTAGTNGSCICPSGTIWDPSTKYCYSCNNSPINLCGINACSGYYVDQTGTQCLLCGANTVNRTNTTPINACTCATGYTWSNGTCNLCATSQGQYITNGNCLACTSVNALMNGSTPQSNPSGCLCAQNYQFIQVGTSYQCSCNNSNNLFDLGNGQGCGSCLNIAGGVNFNPNTTSCTCTPPLVWNTASQKCGCATVGTYLKYGVACAPCSETPTNTGVNPNSITSCLCSNITVWNSSYSECVCKGNGTVLNQYYNGSTCVTCGGSSLGIMDGYNKCLCPPNSVWNKISFSCVCNSLSVLVGTVCTPCLSIPNALAPTTATACTCAAGWTWSITANTCLCSNTTCSCSLVPNTAYSSSTKKCQPCISFDVNANPNWITGQQQCSCKGAFVWQLSNSTNGTYSCVCPASTTANPVVKVNISCILCDHTISSFNQIITNTSACNCFPNYVWSTTFFTCAYSPKNGTNVTISVQFLNGNNASCSTVFNSTTSKLALDNFNCACLSISSIFNDLTGTCFVCPYGRANAVTCKCPSGQDWNILMMNCTTTTPPAGQFNNPFYTKCIQPVGLASPTLIAYSSSDSNQIYVSGEPDFLALASSSTIYANFAGYKCNCASGYGWNAIRKRCYPTTWSYKY